MRQYTLDKSTFSATHGRFQAKVSSPSGSAPLNFAASFYASCSVRVKISEDTPRWQVMNPGVRCDSTWLNFM